MTTGSSSRWSCWSSSLSSSLLLRSIVAPLLLIGTVVLSFFAALGLSAFFFNNVFDFPGADASFPLFTFVFLVALGIDYNIFLMTRVQEESKPQRHQAGHPQGTDRDRRGHHRRAGIVLAATFLVLGVLPLVFLREIGFAVAAGVLIDTFIVRSLLVPASCYDIGRRSGGREAGSRAAAGTRRRRAAARGGLTG